MISEEILKSDSALWWSRDGRYLCYASFDDSGVPKHSIPLFGSSMYGETYHVPYPKVSLTLTFFVHDVCLFCTK